MERVLQAAGLLGVLSKPGQVLWECPSSNGVLLGASGDDSPSVERLLRNRSKAVRSAMWRTPDSPQRSFGPRVTADLRRELAEAAGWLPDGAPRRLWVGGWVDLDAGPVSPLAPRRGPLRGLAEWLQEFAAQEGPVVIQDAVDFLLRGDPGATAGAWTHALLEIGHRLDDAWGTFAEWNGQVLAYRASARCASRVLRALWRPHGDQPTSHSEDDLLFAAFAAGAARAARWGGDLASEHAAALNGLRYAVERDTGGPAPPR